MSEPILRRPRLAIALDVDDQDAAMRLAASVAAYFDVAKVGLELYAAAGPSVVEQLVSSGYSVFVDLKLHDIPTTVERAARVLGRLGASYATVHAAGGVDMLAAAVAGFKEGADSVGLPAPVTLGVTVLTSDVDAPAGLLSERVRVVLAAGAGGVVCAAPDLSVVKRVAPDLVAVVPGVRPENADAHDQSRVATPRDAVAMGADVLVIGRPVARAGDPAKAAEAIARSLGLLAR